MVRPKEVSCKRSFFFPFPPTYAERKKAIYPVVSVIRHLCFYPAVGAPAGREKEEWNKGSEFSHKLASFF